MAAKCLGRPGWCEQRSWIRAYGCDDCANKSGSHGGRDPTSRHYRFTLGGELSSPRTAAADRWHDGYFRARQNRTFKSARVANVLISGENINMLANISLLGQNPISQTRIDRPQCRERICQSSGGAVDLDDRPTAGEFLQSTWNVKAHHSTHLFFRRDFDGRRALL